ncbi:MAG: hypothetical protein COW02_16410 [Comamonadaceae bacterium CG12_big_fil_rev_8_21_14_0_65_59_15]|nr:MAG: hypothetical protein COW02_16410 [Comamonadaceae bacterium CG12_big_fil_rev_8_21_14_0_65_59_15]
MPQITLKQPGQPVADFAFSGALVTVSGVAIDCAARQSDSLVTVEIRGNKTGATEGGNGAYLAQIDIPAKRYITTAGPDDAQGKPTSIQEAIPLDPNAVQVTLWPTVG